MDRWVPGGGQGGKDLATGQVRSEQRTGTGIEERRTKKALQRTVVEATARPCQNTATIFWSAPCSYKGLWYVSKAYEPGSKENISSKCGSNVNLGASP
jgi:hypothetical protein